MPRTTVSGQEASNKRDAIVGAAVRLFGDQGVTGTSMRQIAQAVGVTDATLYHYFPGKDALLEAAFQSASFQVADLEAAFDTPAGSLRDALLSVGRAFLDVLAHDEAWTRLVVGESLRAPGGAHGSEMGAMLGRLARHRTGSLAEALRREAEAGRIVGCDAPMVAAHFFHACVGFFVGEVLIAQGDPAPERPEAFLAYHVDLIVGRLIGDDAPRDAPA